MEKEINQELNTKEYSFVIDINKQQLSPTPVNNAWYLIRKKKARLYHQFPMVIQLNYEVEVNNDDKGYDFKLGVDDGSKHVGVAIVQECDSKNKVVFKGTIEQRQDVSKKMTERSMYRRNRRSNKRYRKPRFNNRSSSKRSGRLAPSIKQKKDTIINFVKKLSKWIKLNDIYLEDVAIDIRALTEDIKLYSWQYQKSNRLDENLRKATILRDKNTCQLCGKKNSRMEAHHITPRRCGGADTIYNLITLCDECHRKVTGHESEYEEQLYIKIKGNKIMTKDAMHVMQGKNYLREELSKIVNLHLTDGGTTANRRIDFDIEKSHSNDAICTTGLKPNTVNIQEWLIKPIRRRPSILRKNDKVLNFKHGHIASYTYKNGEKHIGYVIALFPDKVCISIKSPTKVCSKVNAKKCELLWKPKNFYFIKC